MEELHVIRLRRQQTSTQWGFKLQGGRDQGLPLFVQKVQPKCLAERKGLAVGDVVLAICKRPSANMTHDEAKTEILRAGNELDLTVQRGAIDISHPAFGILQPSPEPRSAVEDESPFHDQRAPFRQVHTRAFQILTQQLAESEAGGAAPSALTDQPVEDRPQYVQAKERSFQKVYGEH